MKKLTMLLAAIFSVAFFAAMPASAQTVSGSIVVPVDSRPHVLPVSGARIGVELDFVSPVVPAACVDGWGYPVPCRVPRVAPCVDAWGYAVPCGPVYVPHWVGPNFYIGPGPGYWNRGHHYWRPGPGPGYGYRGRRPGGYGGGWHGGHGRR
jgi:hypothetical protein